MSFTAEEAMGVVGSANCDDHPCAVPFTEQDIETVFHYETSCCCGPGHCGSYCDSSSVAAFKLKDGRYVIASEWSDSSGHG